MTSNTFLEIQKAVGKKLKRYDDTQGWYASTTDITQTDVKEIINEVYINELVPLFINKFPDTFRVLSKANSWIATGTVNATSTASTLVATTSIFTNSMIGLYVYNSTDDEKIKIEDYTSATTVTLESAISDTWDGDTIYIIGQEFSFGGDANDIYQLESVGVKYNSTDQYYKTAMFVDKNQLFFQGWEAGSSALPYVYQTTLNIGGVLTSGIGLFPGFQNKVSNALMISALVTPASLSADSDVPRMPVANALIAGAVKKGFEQKHDFDKANYWAQQYEMLTNRAVSRYVPNRARPRVTTEPNRKIRAMMSRTI